MAKIRILLKKIYHCILIKRSHIFNKGYYLQNNPDVNKASLNPLWHFVCVGWREGRNPSKNFNIKYYLLMNEDVNQSGVNPIIHYIKVGKKENRSPNPFSYRQRLTQTSRQTFNKPDNNITLFLHIGQDKTGTSAIQSFLDINRISLFTEHGCLYPNFQEEDLISGVSNNHAIWYRKVLNDETQLINDFNRLIDFCRRFYIDKVIISNEGFLHENNIINTARLLREHKFPIIIKPICYLRRTDLWVESAWKQWGIKQYDSFTEFADLPEHNQIFKNVLAHLEMWSEIINVENITVKPYEKQQLSQGLLHDFCTLVGIDYDKNEWKETRKDSNIGYNRDVVEMLHMCRNLFSGVHDNHLFHLFTDLLGDQFTKKPFESYHLLSPKKRWDLINHNLPFENEIAQKFMRRENGRIFLEPLPDPDEAWEPYTGLSLEKAIPIIINLIDSLHRKLS